MFCIHCGAKLEDHSRFCAICGTAVAAPAPAEPVAEEAPVTPPVVELPAEPIVEEAPVVEEIPAEPAVEEAPAEPVEEEAPAEPIAEEAPAEPIAEEALAEPIAEETPAEPIAEEAPVAPVAEIPAEPGPQPKNTPKAKKAQPASRKPHILVRILMQLLSFILCLVLTASLVATVVLADLNHIMSKNGIQQLVTAVLNPTPAPQRVTPVVGAAGVLMDDGGFTIPEDLDVSDIPEDILTGGDSAENVSALVAWLYQAVAEASDKPLTITEAQVQEFVKDSNISEYIADKLAGYADDFIHNTANTSVTTEEIMAVLDENETQIEKTFDIEITGETRRNLEKSVNRIVVEQDLNATIRQQVFAAVEDAINESVASTGMTWNQIRPVVQVLCADATLYIAIGICVVLMLLLCCLNAYNVPGGLTWIAVPSILVGSVLTLALVMAPVLPSLIPAIPAAAAQVITPFTAALLPIHGGVLALGVLLLIVSILWRIIRSAVARKREAAAV